MPSEKIHAFVDCGSNLKKDWIGSLDLIPAIDGRIKKEDEIQKEEEIKMPVFAYLPT